MITFLQNTLAWAEHFELIATNMQSILTVWSVSRYYRVACITCKKGHVCSKGTPGTMREPVVWWLSNPSHVAVARTIRHVGRSARPSITHSDPHWLWQSYFVPTYSSSRSSGEKLSIPSTSRTFAARRGVPSINLVGRSRQSSCQCPISANSIAAQFTTCEERGIQDRGPWVHQTRQ